MKPGTIVIPALCCMLVYLCLGTKPTRLELHHRGIALLYQREFAAAERVFARLVKRVPDDPVPWINLGIAQLNQAEQGVDRALVSLERARRLDPDEPRVPYCRALILRFIGETDAALMELDRALVLAPSDPDVHYQYALILIKRDQEQRALGHLEVASRLNPRIIGVWHNLFLLYSRSGRDEDAARARAAAQEFQILKTSLRGSPRGDRFTEMGELGEGVRDWRPMGVRTRAGTLAPVRFGDWQEMPIGEGPFALVDHDMDCVAELWCGGERPGIWSFREPVGARLVAELPPLSGVDSFVVGDFDEDGRADLITSHPDAGIVALACTGTDPLRFTETQRFPADKGARLRLVDMDLEGDLDLIRSGSSSSPAIAINRGRRFASFGDPPAPFMELGSGARLLLARDLDRDGDVELLFATSRGVQLVDNAPQWRFTVDSPRRRLRIPGTVHHMSAADLDGDGDDDLVVAGDAPGVYWNDGTGNFPGPATDVLALAAARMVHVLDVDLDGHYDLLVGTETGSRLLRNTAVAGPGRFREHTQELPAMSAVASADLDGGGDIDLVARTPD